LKLLAKTDDGRTMVRCVCETALSVLDEVLLVCDVHEQPLRHYYEEKNLFWNNYVIVAYFFGDSINLM
jgi:CTP:molybdopterin cytidylyltransferase MocA